MVRTRIAPSPTGDPHVGTAYVALFNYALARQSGGSFILRIEDTDRQRSSAASERMIFDSLAWLGLSWDEGPDVGGPHGPYRQSERTDIYRRHAEMLVASGHAYPCFCDRERLAALREQQKAAKGALGYDGHCRSLDRAEAAARRAAGEEHVIRLAMPSEGTLAVRDLLRGVIEFDAAQVDDQVLMKSDGFPTYHLANVVDDHLMEITHVIRAEEWISSLPKHVRLYQAFGWELPVFCHLPLLRNADKSKISKRKNPVSITYYQRAGYLPEALLNYLALMGWTMPDEREEFTVAELVEHFTLERISLGGPVFDLDKLSWLNGRYLRALRPEQLLERLKRGPLGDDYLLRVLPLVQERIDRLEDFVAYAAFFFTGDVGYDEEARSKLVAKKRTPAETVAILTDLVETVVDPALDWNAALLEERTQGLRVAVTGRAATPPLFETMAVLGKELCRRRLRAAVDVLRGMKE
jgi:glutamyl-tRNA synthetase